MIIHFHIFNIASRILPAHPFVLRRAMMRASGMTIGRNVKVSANVLVYGSFLSVGDDTWIGPDCTFYTNRLGKVQIGANCDIAPQVSFVTGSHKMGDANRRAGDGFCQDIGIGSGCWIGTRSLILGGVRLGKGCVVGAGAVVLPGEYPDNCIYVGVPARLVRSLAS